MGKTPTYYIVEAGVLPEVFRRVVETRRLLDMGEVRTINEAVRRTEISRSAYYKYKDAVRPFQEMLHGRIVTLQVLLRDSPGNLSELLRVFAAVGANILTINQGIPVSGRAAVTVTAETSHMDSGLEVLLEQLESLSGTIRCEVLAG